MSILFGLFAGLLLLTAAAFARSITTLFHELGHAIPALLFTDEKVTIYVGAYEAVEAGWNFSFGRLRGNIMFNPLMWNGGLTQHSGTTSFWKTLLIILGGPIASMIIALPLIYLMLLFPSVKIVQFLAGLYITSAVLDLISNLIPSSKPTTMKEGQVVYNDGFALLALILTRNQLEKGEEEET
ncbi:MAG: M50 family metallopeptidase [Bacteroidota bacterium]